jgi:site-specific DNA-methyltransferase (adenine-specific)
MNQVWHCEALDVLKRQPDKSVDLVYVDPPFGTGNRQEAHGMSYEDSRVAYNEFLWQHVHELHRVLKPTGTLYLHLDWHWCHHGRVSCDSIFGPENFLNEVIWAYDYGGRGKDRWPRKHDNILVYAKEAGKHVFNWEEIDRIPYMAPGLQKDPQRALDGKVPTDVWWMSIVGTQAHERSGYPTQKPVKLVERAVIASSPLGGLVLDVFAGSGTTGEAAHKHGRSFILADTSPWAYEVMQERFQDIPVEWHGCHDT